MHSFSLLCHKGQLPIHLPHSFKWELMPSSTNYTWDCHFCSFAYYWLIKSLNYRKYNWCLHLMIISPCMKPVWDGLSFLEYYQPCWATHAGHKWAYEPTHKIKESDCFIHLFFRAWFIFIYKHKKFPHIQEDLLGNMYCLYMLISIGNNIWNQLTDRQQKWADNVLNTATESPWT